jgi:hypothetical protein
MGERPVLSPRSREIAILLGAFHWDRPFELYAHRRAGLAAGLTGAEIDALASRRPPPFRCPEERLAFNTTLALLDRQHLDETERAAAVSGLGSSGLGELVALVGYDDLVA